MISALHLTNITAAVGTLAPGTILALSLSCSNLVVSPLGFQPLTSSLVFSMTVPALQAGDTGNSYECEFAVDTSDASNMAWSKFEPSHPTFTVRLGQTTMLSFESPLNFNPVIQAATALGGVPSDELVLVPSGCMANLAIVTTCYSTQGPDPLPNIIQFSSSLASNATFAATDTDVRFRFVAPRFTTRSVVLCGFQLRSTDSRGSFGFGTNSAAEFTVVWVVESAASLVGIFGLDPVRPSGWPSNFLVGLTANPVGGVTLALSCTDLVISPSRLFFPHSDSFPDSQNHQRDILELS